MAEIVSRPGKLAGHVFISYVREDSHRVDELQRALEDAGIPVWRDTANLWPGEDWRAKIRQAITDNALVFLACFSQGSLARGKSYQNEELVLAIEQLRQRPPERPWLIPVRLDDCEIPNRDIGGGRTLASIQRADLFGDRSEDAASRLVTTVLRILGQHFSVSPASKRMAQATDQRQREEPSETPEMTSSLPGGPRTTAQAVGSSKEGDPELVAFPNRDSAAGETADTSARHKSGQANQTPRKRRMVLAFTTALIVLAAILSAVLFTGNQPQSVSPTAVRTIGFPNWVAAVAFSPNGHILATGTGDGDHKVVLWNVENPAQPTRIATFSHDTDTVRTVVFSPNGRILATASWDHTVSLWNIANPAQPRRIATITRHTDKVEALAFSPDGQTLVTGGWDQLVFLWNVANPTQPTLIATLTGHTNNVRNAAFSPDGRTLATASWDHTVILWNVANRAHPTLVRTLTGHTDIASAVAFSPNGHILASGSTDHTVILWNVTHPANAYRITTFTPAKDWVQALAYSPDGRTLAIGNRPNTAVLWNVADPTHPSLIATLTGHNSFVEAVAFSPNGKWLATGSNDHTVIIWRLR